MSRNVCKSFPSPPERQLSVLNFDATIVRKAMEGKENPHDSANP